MAFEFLKKLFRASGADSSTVADNSAGICNAPLQADEPGKLKVAIELFAIRTAINFIADSIAASEFKMMNRYNNLDTYRLNVKPNTYETAAQFRYNLAYKLISTGEVLIIEFNNELIIADSYLKNTQNPLEHFFENIIIHGSFKLPLRKSINQVIYITHDDRNIKLLLLSVLNSYNELMSASLDYQSTGGREKGVLEIGALARGDRNYQKNIYNLLNEDFNMYFNSKKGVIPLTEGFKYTPQNKADSKNSEAKDFIELKDSAMSVAGTAFKIPDGILRGDIANIEQIMKSYLLFCLNPWAERIGQAFMKYFVKQRDYDNGIRIYLDTTGVQITNMIDMSANIDKLISSGIQSQNEIRGIFRQPLINEPAANNYYVTKNYTQIGGEEQ